MICMTRTLTVFAALFTLSGLASADKPHVLDQPPSIRWRTDYPAARKEAEARKQPIVILFLKSMNPLSERLVAKIAAHAKLAEYLNSRTIPLRIEGADERELIKSLQINQYPTLILADSDGRVRGHLIGFQDPDELLERLRMTFPEPKPTPP